MTVVVACCLMVHHGSDCLNWWLLFVFLPYKFWKVCQELIQRINLVCSRSINNVAVIWYCLMICTFHALLLDWYCWRVGNARRRRITKLIFHYQLLLFLLHQCWWLHHDVFWCWIPFQSVKLLLVWEMLQVLLFHFMWHQVKCKLVQSFMNSRTAQRTSKCPGAQADQRVLKDHPGLKWLLWKAKGTILGHLSVHVLTFCLFLIDS